MIHNPNERLKMCTFRSLGNIHKKRYHLSSHPSRLSSLALPPKNIKLLNVDIPKRESATFVSLSFLDSISQLLSILPTSRFPLFYPFWMLLMSTLCSAWKILTKSRKGKVKCLETGLLQEDLNGTVYGMEKSFPYSHFSLFMFPGWISEYTHSNSGTKNKTRQEQFCSH